MAQHNLAALPSEVIGSFTSHLDNHSLLSLRDTSRSLQAATADEFGNRFCSSLKLTLIPLDFQMTLDRILKWDDLAAKVRSIQFSDPRPFQFAPVLAPVNALATLDDLLKKLIARVTNLESLTIKSPIRANRLNPLASTPEAAQVLRTFAQGPIIRPLKTITFKDCDFSGAELQSFLTVHAASLKTLTFSNVYLQPGDWSLLIQFMRDHMSSLNNVAMQFLAHNNNTLPAGPANAFALQFRFIPVGGANVSRSMRDPVTGKIGVWNFTGAGGFMCGSEHFVNLGLNRALLLIGSAAYDAAMV